MTSLQFGMSSSERQEHLMCGLSLKHAMGVALIVVGMMFCSCTSKKQGREPVVNGHPLGYWLDVLVDKNKVTDVSRAELAVCKLGTNCIPYCISCLSVPDQRRTGPYTGSRAVYSVDNLRGGAAKAIELLGAQARPAIPNLTKLLGSDNVATVMLSARVLSTLGPLGVRSVVEDIASRPPASQAVIVKELSFAGTNIVPYVPYLMSNLDRFEQQTAVDCCGIIVTGCRGSTNLLPSFVNALHSDNPKLRYAAVWALLFMGTNAVQALPDLKGLTVDSDDAVARVARNAVAALSSERTADGR
jgi:hypothetical protein